MKFSFPRGLDSNQDEMNILYKYNKMCDGKYINVFSLIGSNEYYVDTAILRSLLQLETELPMQTYIAMCWNRKGRLSYFRLWVRSKAINSVILHQMHSSARFYWS